MHAPRIRILVVRLSHLGDVVCALPLLEALRDAHPSAVIGWIVQPEFAGLLRGHPALDEVLTFDRDGGFDGLLNLERDLAAFHADWAIDAQGNAKSAMVALTSRANRRTGPARVDWAEPIASGALNDVAPPASDVYDEPAIDASRPGVTHLVQRMHALARHVAPGAPFEPHGPRAFRVGDIEAGRARFRAAFPRTNDSPARRVVVVHASRAHDPRSLPIDLLERCVRDLATDHEVLVVCGPADREEGRRLATSLRGLPHAHVWPDPLELDAFGAFLRAAAEQGAVFAGGDTGPMHLAWSAGMPVVIWAGPTDARATGPWPVARNRADDRHRVVRVEHHLECAPCRSRICEHPEGNVCLAHVDPAAVARRVRELTSRVPS